MNGYQLYDNKILLSLLCEGDETAFTELYHRYWKPLFSIAYNRLREMQTAEDIVHDVFASLWTNRQKIHIDSLENYLATAVKYMVLARIKRMERDRAFKLNTGSEIQEDVTVENKVHFKRILEIIELEVEKLPEKCKLIFKYSREQEMPAKDIARVMQISPKTVENQLNKALRQLKLVAKSFLNLL